ncbi:hypothetical protein [Streptomyces sp. SID10815]|uniref:hypothetical protein n=1 Tax=Streptomyces sp. SID10815 TaxID=2706027 RepID=UPI0013C7A5F2|nr:hypothetical protein [Streptomyces sp. SID10815]NEA52359.1 hypothetical protein [Streptomyces sp. SID10815]
MTRRTGEPPNHNTLTCIKQYNCQRPECVARHNAYQRRVYRQKGYGTWQPLVDATPARQHINTLRALGHSIPDIQRTANTSPATIARILYHGVNKRAERIRPDVAARILAIPAQPAPLKPTSIIDATGTRRRIQALIHMGWPATELAPLIGFHPRRITDLSHSERVTAETAQRIATAYRKLHTKHPGDHHVSLPAQRLARATATRYGWHGPLAWDDIDNPDCQPDTKGTITRPYRRPKAVIDRDKIARLTTQGYTAAQIAAAIGCSPRSVSRARGQMAKAQQHMEQAA